VTSGLASFAGAAERSLVSHPEACRPRRRCPTSCRPSPPGTRPMLIRP